MPGPLRDIDSLGRPRGPLGFTDEGSAWKNGNAPGPAGLGHRRPIRVADAEDSKVSDKPAPKLIIIDYGGGLPDKEMQTVISEAKRALDATTRHAKDASLKKKGVEVTSKKTLQGGGAPQERLYTRLSGSRHQRSEET
jgi:hypothetical protein